jgi:hypothetical protein
MYAKDDEFYHFGIIDFLTKYDFQKKVERCGKITGIKFSLNHNTNISVANPLDY